MKTYEELNGLNFSVGPVEMDKETKLLGGKDIPYFRTAEFSKIVKENEKLLKKFVDAEEDDRVILLTSSGTGAMEASVMNLFGEDDKVLVVNGGSFGSRFVEICKIHGINVVELKLKTGMKLREEHLEKYRGIGLTGFIVNVHETSTGVLYDMNLISEFCKSENLKLIVDSISSFLADEYSMKEYGTDITIIGAQKGLSLPPGLAILVLSKRAIQIIKEKNVKSMYFNLADYLKNGERGQTPFTPAVGIIIQLNEKLNRINEVGIEKYINKSKELAQYFRSKIKEYPFEFASENMSNAVTSLYVTGSMKAHDLFEYVKDNYNIYLCPNGGELKDKLIRVGHIGNLDKEKVDRLFEVLDKLKEEKLI